MRPAATVKNAKLPKWLIGGALIVLVGVVAIYLGTMVVMPEAFTALPFVHVTEIDGHHESYLLKVRRYNWDEICAYLRAYAREHRMTFKISSDRRADGVIGTAELVSVSQGRIVIGTDGSDLYFCDLYRDQATYPEFHRMDDDFRRFMFGTLKGTM